MSDEELIEEVAKLWISNGGDAEGMEWCWGKIRDKIKELSNDNGDNHDTTL